MSKIRRSHDRLIFNMGISIPGKDGLYIETGPWYLRVFLHVLLSKGVMWFEEGLWEWSPSGQGVGSMQTGAECLQPRPLHHQLTGGWNRETSHTGNGEASRNT